MHFGCFRDKKWKNKKSSYSSFGIKPYMFNIAVNGIHTKQRPSIQIIHISDSDSNQNPKKYLHCPSSLAPFGPLYPLSLITACLIFSSDFSLIYTIHSSLSLSFYISTIQLIFSLFILESDEPVLQRSFFGVAAFTWWLPIN